MNCELAQEQIVLAAYGELPAAQADELERHLAICPECGREQAGFESFQELLSAHGVEEPEANLVARAHAKLDEALDALPAPGLIGSIRQWLGKNWTGLRAAPAAAGFLLAVGLGGGVLGGYQMAVHAHLRAPVAAPKPLAVAQGAKISPENSASHASAVANNTQTASAQTRENSFAALTEECRRGTGCQDTESREILMTVLHSSRNAHMREKALEGLEPYIADDLSVRNAVLDALLNDRDARIRAISIHLLEPVEADTSVRQVLYSVSNSDESPQIRNVSRQVLSQMPEVQ